MTVPRALLALLVALGCVLASDAATARTRVLLVGVSEYPNFPAEKQLKAPANDVRRMQAALQARGIAGADIAVLADGVEGAAGVPTRAAILAGLERLAQEAERGDLVIFYASGHGTRQPSRTRLKVDGLDQVFLPRDAAPPGPGAAPNRFETVIAGPDFGERLDAIRARGADVWFILDSCFSGSASRAVGDGVHDKKIALEDIGLATAGALSPETTTVLADLAPALPAGSGRLTAFYASQPNETAREVALPPGAPADKRVWGSIFTTALTEALRRAPALSYRQLMVETGRVLRADAAFQARQTPSFEGDGMDGALPGAAGTASAPAWRVNAGVLHAGQIEGGEAGAGNCRHTPPPNNLPGGARRYHSFDAWQEQAKTKNQLDLWDEVVALHAQILGWFEEPRLYNKIGFLVACGTPIGSILGWAQGADDQSAPAKSAFEALLNQRIRTALQADINDDLDALHYASRADYDKLQRILLLFNIATCRGRFPFEHHVGQAWSLEHIHAQQAQKLNRVEQWETWLQAHRQALQTIQTEHNAAAIAPLLAAINTALPTVHTRQFDQEQFNALAGGILLVLNNGVAEEADHSLANLALLQHGANAALSNAVFEVKRQRVLDMDKRGDYIPAATRNVFLKYYTPADKLQPHFWGEDDKTAYLAHIKTTLTAYLQKTTP